MSLRNLILAFAALLACAGVSAQTNVRAILEDASTGEGVSFATVSLTRQGQTKAFKYVLSTDVGAVDIEGVKAGKYTLKAELLGYVALTREIEVGRAALDLGKLQMQPDKQQLEAARVSAVGNPIVIKKDTIEYNASSFRTTDNDMLEDLLKKLPGVEVASDGTVTANGEEIKKITIDGKTFFLDDPSLASKNIPAKIIEKVKVVEKKSDQALFTGIDDGEEETVIDLSVKPGMMNGWFGNMRAGGGHDLQESFQNGDYRWEGAAMVGRFTKKSQISVILNANNTNNRGFNDLAGSMMGNMRGGGGMGGGTGGWTGSGITTSWMAGVNGAWDLFDDKMNLGGNYLYNGSDKSILEQSVKTTYLDGGDQLIYGKGGPRSFGGDDGYGYSVSNTSGHRFGIRLDHKFSDNTSILFEPQFNFGSGSYGEYSDFTTMSRSAAGESSLVNKGWENTAGVNRNWTARGFLLFRQRLGKAGRTLSVNASYNFSGNDLNGVNQSSTTSWEESVQNLDEVNQWIDRSSNSKSLSARAVYTEPLSEKLFLSAYYGSSWSVNQSVKDAYNVPIAGSGILFPQESAFWGEATSYGTKDDTYSNTIYNESFSHNTGANLQLQTSKLRVQLGAAFIPTKTHNETNGKDYDSMVYNWSPEAMLRYEFNDNSEIFMFYRGRSSQPSTSQLMPVPDNSNPLAVSFGNPYLTPYFTHSLRGHFGYTDKQTFFSVRGRFGATLTQNPIVSAIWYGSNGAQYSMPVNGPDSGGANLDFFLNAPIAKSNFSISNSFRANYSRSASYIGKDSFDSSKYYNPDTAEFDYEQFNKDYGTRELMLGAFNENVTRSFSMMERFTLKYQSDNLELSGSFRTRYNRSTYTVSDGTATFANQARGECNWTVGGGVSLNTRLNYNWYNGYTTPQEDEFVWDAEVSKLLFKNKCTLALKCYDILNRSKNVNITDASNYHQEMRNNTLGRYLILSLTYRFGTFDKNNMRRGPGGPGGPPPGR